MPSTNSWLWLTSLGKPISLFESVVLWNSILKLLYTNDLQQLFIAPPNSSINCLICFQVRNICVNFSDINWQDQLQMTPDYNSFNWYDLWFIWMETKCSHNWNKISVGFMIILQERSYNLCMDGHIQSSTYTRKVRLPQSASTE